MEKGIVVVGNGLAAMHFIHHLNENIMVWWIQDYSPESSSSNLAKGGVSISFGLDKQAHINETYEAGSKLGNLDVIKKVIYEGESVYEKLQCDLNLKFCAEPKKEGGHSKARVRCITDETGKNLIQGFVTKLRNRAYLKELKGYKLLAINYDLKRFELSIIDKSSGKLFRLFSSSVVLAMGGMAGLYPNHSNGLGSKGEGLAIAKSLNLTLKNLPFMQFHPTLLFEPQNPSHHLLTEALRGAGAIIRNANGDDFLKEIHPLGSLAPRDVVSASIYREMRLNMVRNVYLDLSKVKRLKSKFPFVFNLLNIYGYKSKFLIPVIPGAHYQCGGVVAKINGSSSVAGLFILGEMANTGLHGANRLASNSLLEVLVMGQFAAQTINDNLFDDLCEVKILESNQHLLCNPQTIVENLQKELGKILWDYYGILRIPESMRFGLQSILELKEKAGKLNRSWLPTFTFQNQIEAALSMAEQACELGHTIGCHVVEKSTKFTSNPFQVG